MGTTAPGVPQQMSNPNPQEGFWKKFDAERRAVNIEDGGDIFMCMILMSIAVTYFTAMEWCGTIPVAYMATVWLGEIFACLFLGTPAVIVITALVRVLKRK